MEQFDLNFNLNYWILQSIAMAVTVLLIPKLRVTSLFGPTAAVVALAFVNAHIWDAALFLKIPDSASTKALTVFLANGAIFWLIVKILPGIEVTGVLPALIAPVVFTATSVLIAKYGQSIDFLAVGKECLDWIKVQRDHLMAFEGALESTRQFLA